MEKSRELKHAGPTPGPWRTLSIDEDHPDYAGAVVLAADGGLVADANIFGNPGRSEAENEANAHLIAAAPELVAACRAWVDYFDRLTRDDEPGDPLAAARYQYHRERVEATRAALAKASPSAE